MLVEGFGCRVVGFFGCVVGRAVVVAGWVGLVGPGLGPVVAWWSPWGHGCVSRRRLALRGDGFVARAVVGYGALACREEAMRAQASWCGACALRRRVMRRREVWNVPASLNRCSRRVPIWARASSVRCACSRRSW